MDDLIPTLFAVTMFAFVALAVFVVIYSKINAKKRRAKMRAISESLGLTFFPDGDDQLLSALSGFKLFSQGRLRNMSSLIRCDTGAVKIAIFDYVFRNSGGEHLDIQVQTVVAFQSSKLKCPEFSMRLECMHDKIGMALGFQNIYFESYPKFSRMFVLQGSNEEAIRDYFSPSLIEFFEQNSGISVEAIADTMVCYRPRKRTRASKIKNQLSQAYKIYGAMVDRS